jgi:hypothetical protein
VPNEAGREDIPRNIAALEAVARCLASYGRGRPIERFDAAARERLHGKDSALRKADVKPFIDREVDDEQVWIIGPTANLAAAMLGSRTMPGVPRFVPGWWSTQSNANPSLLTIPY